jgi:hypothetical protein
VAPFDGEKPSLWKLSLLGATPRKLIDDVGAGSMSPDGTRIAFLKFLPNSENELWVMGADGSSPRKKPWRARPKGWSTQVVRYFPLLVAG